MRSAHRVVLTFLTLALVLTLPAFCSAQTITATAQWNQVEPPAVASTFVNTMKVDTGAFVGLTASCVAAGTGSSCSAPFTVAAPTLSHSYVLLVCTGTFCSSTSTSGQAPGTGGLKILITVTVSTGDNDDEPSNQED